MRMFTSKLLAYEDPAPLPLNQQLEPSGSVNPATDPTTAAEHCGYTVTHEAASRGSAWAAGTPSGTWLPTAEHTQQVTAHSPEVCLSYPVSRSRVFKQTGLLSRPDASSPKSLANPCFPSSSTWALVQSRVYAHFYLLGALPALFDLFSFSPLICDIGNNAW